MKLRNKKTGRIINSKELLTDEFIIDLFSRDFDYFNSKLHKLQDEWEEYEELKKYWYISPEGKVYWFFEDDEGLEASKEIGNYFESEEEAEKAVEKLKAWKQLKDKGFRFKGWDNTARSTIHNFSLFVTIEDLEDINRSLDLLFGGEE